MSSTLKIQLLFVHQMLALAMAMTLKKRYYARNEKFFRPEFLNRFNGIVEFLHLDKDALQDIVNLLLDDVQVTLDKKGITMDVSQDAKDWLIEEGYDEELGARPLRRIVEQQVRDKITDYYLDHTDVKHVDIDVEDNELVVKGK